MPDIEPSDSDSGIERWCQRCRRSSPPVTLYNYNTCTECRLAANALRNYWLPARTYKKRYRAREIQSERE